MTCSPLDSSGPDAAPLADRVPALPTLLRGIGDAMARGGEIALLSFTVLPRRGPGRQASWPAYEAMVRETARFVGGYAARSMRRDDHMLEMGQNGNACVLLLSAPRRGRAFEPGDLARVRERILRRLRRHLAAALDREALESFGCYVGGAVTRPEPAVGAERVVYRALEESVADALNEKEREEVLRAAELARVLRQELVRTVYQPVVDMVGRRVIGFEALTRPCPCGFETPDVLFKAARDSTTLWSLERMCRRKALESHPGIVPGQMLFLNAEPESLRDPELSDGSFERFLATFGLEPGQVVLEMTEHAEVRDFASFRRTLEGLRARGFRLAMDDVGSGYSGLQTIAELAPDYIKIDMTLVRDLHASPIKQELVTTIRRFAENTGISLVAEGVERVEELASLLRAGVRCAQGYLFARPHERPAPPDWDRLP